MSRQSRPTVLVIDDDEASRLSLHVVLGAEFEVLTSGDGPSALALLRLYGADVLLLNLLMPGMSGLEALSDIKALYPDLQVIVVTPLGDTRIVVESVRRGAEDYLTKPWDEETLLSAVRAAAVRGRDTTHCVLLVGNDSERLAPFQVIMGIRVLAVAMALEEALVGPALKPWLIVLDGGVDPTHDATALRILAERYPGRPTIVTTRSPASVLRADVCAMADVVAAPYHVSDILNRIHRILSTRVGHTKSGPWLSHHVGGAIDYLTDHYRAVVPLANVARFAGLSVDRLAHVFRAKVGMTMKEYAARLRVCVGCQLLAHSDRKLEDIAQCLGFDHASHFSRVFTDMMGLRPGEYRRRVRGDGGGYLSCWRSSAAGSTTTTPRCLTRRWGCEVRPSAEWKRL